MIDGSPDVVSGDVSERGAEARGHPRPQVQPEGSRPPQMVLDQSPLRLVEAERRRLADRRAKVLAGQELLVEAVAELVEGREEATRESMGRERGGETHVARPDPDRRRIRRLVEPP